MDLSSYEPTNWGSDMVSVYRLSDSNEIAMHRFFDSSAISPSGEYIAYTVFPFDSRLPVPGEIASVIVRHIATSRVVYSASTSAWDTQLGAQVQWGADDNSLLFNRMNEVSWKAYGVVVDPFSGTERILEGQIYMVSPDGRQSVSCRLEKLGFVQPGYGVHIPPDFNSRNLGASAADGVFITDTVTGEERLVISYSGILKKLPEVARSIDLSKGAFYGFHVKFSPDGNKILLLLRWLPAKGIKTKNFLISLNVDGSDVKLAVHAKNWGNGHHPNWCPDSQHIIMNVSIKNPNVNFPFIDRSISKIMRKIGIRYYTRSYDLRVACFGLNGEDLEVVSKSGYGSGHPTMHISGRFALTDAYPDERVSRGDGTSPIRTFDLSTGKEVVLMHVPATPSFYGARKEWRVDPHPAWDRTGRFLVFNAAPDAKRGVYVADFKGFISSEAYR